MSKTPLTDAEERDMQWDGLLCKAVRSEAMRELELRLADASTAQARLSTMTQAVGLATTIKPSMVMRADDPLGMMREVVEYVAQVRDGLLRAMRNIHEIASREYDRDENCAWNSAGDVAGIAFAAISGTEIEPTFLYPRDQELEEITAYAEHLADLLREWKATELDTEDDEYQPWIDSFTARVDAALAATPSSGANQQEKS